MLLFVVTLQLDTVNDRYKLSMAKVDNNHASVTFAGISFIFESQTISFGVNIQRNNVTSSIWSPFLSSWPS